MRYLKWAFNNTVGHSDNQKFELDKVIICDIWDPTNSDWEKRGGFNFTNEECALRWMSRGDTLYEVEIPDSAEVLNVVNEKTPNGIIVSNKIILKNPVPISDELLLDFYKKSKLPLSTYFECIGLLASRGYYDLALTIIKDKVNMNNIDLALEKFKRALKPWHEVNYDCYSKVQEVLEEIKSDIDINLFIDKEPFIKDITSDKIINITGESGSGKSTYCEKYKNDNYIIIDTDVVLKDKPSNNKEIEELRKTFIGKPKDYIINDFDDFYLKVLEYFKGSNKTIVIDSAQYRNIKDVSIIKGKLIVVRTSIETCYERTLNRYKSINKNYDEDEYQSFAERKKGMFRWYKAINKFLEKIDRM